MHWKRTNIRHVLHQASSISSLPEHPFFWDVSVAQLETEPIQHLSAQLIHYIPLYLSTVWICIRFWSCVARKQWCLWNYISALLIFIKFHLYPWIHQAFTCERNRCHPLKKNQYTTCAASVVINVSASWASFFGDDSVAQLVALMSGVVLGGVAGVVGSGLAGGKIFTASIGSVDSLYPSVFIYCLNLHQILILCSLKAMMFVKLYFRTSDIYLISLVSLNPSGFHLRTK